MKICDRCKKEVDELDLLVKDMGSHEVCDKCEDELADILREEMDAAMAGRKHARAKAYDRWWKHEPKKPWWKIWGELLNRPTRGTGAQ